eukprot:849118-Amphidinium_carterae.1
MLCILAPPIMHTQLDRPISSRVLATDATVLKGAVVSADLCSASQAGFLWRASDRANYQMEFVPAVVRAMEGEDPLTQPLFTLKFPYRDDPALTAFVECTQFVQGPKFRFDREAHMNRQELAAWLVGIRFALTHGGGRDERLLCLLDSAVCVNIIRRGRSSSHQLNRIMRRALVLQVLHRCDVAPIWVPTKSNPADDGTRNAKLRRARPMREDDARLWEEAMLDSEWSDRIIGLQWVDKGLAPTKGSESDRDRWWMDAFDKTRGYPGEGLGRAHAPQALSDLRVRVQPITEERYRLRVSEFEKWLNEQQLPALQFLVEHQYWQAADAAMTAYVQCIHNEGAPVSHGTWTLAGAQYLYPALNGHLTGSWLTQRQWQRLVPIQMRPPLPTRLLLALVVTASTLDLEEIMSCSPHWIPRTSRPRRAVIIAASALGTSERLSRGRIEH